MTVEELLHDYMEANLRHVDIDEVTALSLAGAEPRRSRWWLLPATPPAGHAPRPRWPRLAAAATVVAALGAGVAWALTSRPDEPTIIDGGTIPAADAPVDSDAVAGGGTVADTAAASMTTVVPVPPSASPEATVPISAQRFGEIVERVVTTGDSPLPTSGFELRETDVRPASDGSPSLFASFANDRGRLFVQSVEGTLDVAEHPPYPGDTVLLDLALLQLPTWVWPVDAQYNTIAVVADRRTIIVRSEGFDPAISVVGDLGFSSVLVNELIGVANVVVKAMTTELGEEGESTPVTTPPVPEGTTLVPLTELDAPGERTLLTESDQALADGPLVDAAGRTYGADSGETPLLPSVDFQPIMDPNDPRQVVVGFIGPRLIGDSSTITFAYGFGGDVVGWFRQRDITDAHGTRLWGESDFTQAPTSGDVPLADLPEMVAFDLDGDQVLSRAELRASAGGMRRVIGNGMQGNVYATDLVPFLESMAGVDDPTTGAVSAVVPFFDLALQPAGTIDLGAADTVLFDEAGQPIGGWNSEG